jgi:hypothetical protein
MQKLTSGDVDLRSNGCRSRARSPAAGCRSTNRPIDGCKQRAIPQRFWKESHKTSHLLLRQHR